ncbi:MAG: hypothetical protein K0S24_1290 [Sphingobacterium sp.]|jgi:hypothetical protein|nr:hypothetical protein [Sphingobacterium sp.]
MLCTFYLFTSEYFNAWGGLLKDNNRTCKRFTYETCSLDKDNNLKDGKSIQHPGE